MRPGGPEHPAEADRDDAVLDDAVLDDAHPDDGRAGGGEHDDRPWSERRPLPPVPPAAPRRRDARGATPAPHGAGAGTDDGPREGAAPRAAAPLPPPPYPAAAVPPAPYPVASPTAARPLPPHPGAVRPRSGPMRAVPPGRPAADATHGTPAPPPTSAVPAPEPQLQDAAARPPVPPAGRRPARPLPPVPPPRRRFVPSPDETQLIPVLPAVPQAVLEDAEVEARDGAAGASGGILRAAGAMAVATLVSRVTGLLRTIVLAAAIGSRGLVPDAYNTANTLPNIIYELLLGGVLTSVIIPLLVRAQEKDADGGVGYAQRMATLAVAGLTGVTAVAVLAAPLLTALYGITGDADQVALANWLARLLLLEIVFYGVGALATAILNSREVYGLPAWAPVLNNVVVIATGGVFIAISHHGPLTPGTIRPLEVWLLGAGTTLGIVVQSLVLLPLLRRVGVPLRPRWGLRQVGLREAGTLGLWVTAYAAISQVGVIVATNVANHAGRARALGSNAYAVANLLFQMPYGIIGVALLTALLPRMSRAALRQDTSAVVQDLALGTRLSALGLLPVTAALVVLGPAVAVVGFAHGKTTIDDAAGIGQALALGAFGLLPMAVTLLQLRVFYAMRDARTPTLIQLGMVAVRVPLLLVLAAVLPPERVLAGIMVGTSVTYVAGWVLGDVLLRRRLGALRTRETLGSLLKVAAVSAAAGVTGELAVRLVRGLAGPTRTGSLVVLLVGTVVIGAAALAGTLVARVPEVREPLAAARVRLGRG